MSLNQIVDNILQIVRNNNVAESEHLSKLQIEQWILAYRAKLIKQEIDKGQDINEMYLTTIEPIHLDRKETTPGHYVYVGDQELPKLLDFHYRPGVINVRDMFGNLIQLGSRTKAKYQKYRKATCKDYIAWIQGNKIYVAGDSNQLEYISVDVIAEDPTEDNACYNPDDEFPIPTDMIPVITQLIFANEIANMVIRPSDYTNDSNDDIARSHTAYDNKRKRRTT